MAAPASGYLQPPKEVRDVLLAPLPPVASVSPSREHLLLATAVRYAPVADLAEPFLRLAGTRVVPRNRSLHGGTYYSAYSLLRIADASVQIIELPKDARASLPRWSYDGRRFVFTHEGENSVELWGGDVSSTGVRRLGSFGVNLVLGHSIHWLHDHRTLLVKLVPQQLVAPPPAPRQLPGPALSETSGQKTAFSTYETRDVLKTPHDEALFDYYATSQLALVDFESGSARLLHEPRLYAHLELAPNGKHLLTESLHRPYSYQVGHKRFPRKLELWLLPSATVGDKLLLQPVSLLVDVPLAAAVPIHGVRTGPRKFEWRANEPATLVWAEALDQGDWKVKADQRDRIMMLREPFISPEKQQASAADTGLCAFGSELMRLEFRLGDIHWGEGSLALVESQHLIRHWQHTHIVDFPTGSNALSTPPRLLYDLSYDEKYEDPGSPAKQRLPNGQVVLQQEPPSAAHPQGCIFFQGMGATPEGLLPFLDRLDLQTLQPERLFRCDSASFEYFVAWVDLPGGRFMTRRESLSEHPNFYIRTLLPASSATTVAPFEPSVSKRQSARTSSAVALTQFPDPSPLLRQITKRLVRYKRADGLELSCTMLLPPGYKEGSGVRLPTILYAYPHDFADQAVAGQVSTSPNRFTFLGYPLHQFLLLRGFAMIDSPTIPVVGDVNCMYDTYMEQLVAGARAAVEKAIEMGFCDPERIGVTGHSHGGLMTTNLLLHSDMFRAGVARSGAYNRTLTAFGFQTERRTYWEAPEVYHKVSPFFHINKLRKPLLLIHGAEDMNPGMSAALHLATLS
jgi:dipeptidyl aminopeptidase/acylaminoacyl peptidase